MSTVAVATEDLIGKALDWAVSRVMIADGVMTEDCNEVGTERPYLSCKYGRVFLWGAGKEMLGTINSATGKPHVYHGPGGEYSPSEDWWHAGDALHRHAVAVKPDDAWSQGGGEWSASCITINDEIPHEYKARGATPLVAGMRAIVGAAYGDTIEIPTELLEQSE